MKAVQEALKLKNTIYNMPKTRELIVHSRQLTHARNDFKELAVYNEASKIVFEQQKNSLSAEDEKKFKLIFDKYNEASTALANFEDHFSTLEGAKFSRLIDLMRWEANALLTLVTDTPEEDFELVDGEYTKNYMINLYSSIIKDIDETLSLRYLTHKKEQSRINRYTGKKMYDYLAKKALAKINKSDKKYDDPTLIKNNLLLYTEIDEKVINKFCTDLLIYILKSNLDNVAVHYRLTETITTIIKLPEYNIETLTDIVQELTHAISYYCYMTEPKTSIIADEKDIVARGTINN